MRWRTFSWAVRRELARFGDVMARVQRGQPWLVTIEGESGVGKTALARQCVSSSPGLNVFWARADQSEANFDYGVVGQLLRPLPGRAQAEGTLLARDISSANPFAVGALLLRLLGDQLAVGPIAVVLDDVQWADRPSVEALAFAFRRFTVEPVAVIVLVRGDRDQLRRAHPPDAAEHARPSTHGHIRVEYRRCGAPRRCPGSRTARQPAASSNLHLRTGRPRSVLTDRPRATPRPWTA